MSLKVKTERNTGGVTNISLIGSIDRRSYSILQEAADAILSQKPKAVIFDMELLDYVNSMGARVLLSSRKKMTQQNCNVFFVKLQPHIKKVFEILDTLPLMQIFESRAELDDYLNCGVGP